MGNSSKRDIHLHKTLLYWTVFSKLWYLIKEQRKISLRCNKIRENLSLTFEGFEDDDNLAYITVACGGKCAPQNLENKNLSFYLIFFFKERTDILISSLQG